MIMMFKKRFDRAFAEIAQVFPFGDYVDDVCYREMFSILRALKTYVPDFKGCRLLDIGSGPMDKTGIMQGLGFQCSAADDLADPWHLQGDNIAKIKGYADSLGIDFCHQKEGNYTTPFEEGTFDVVSALAVIEHLHDSPREFLNTMGRYLKSEGLIVVYMPNSVNLRKRLSVLRGRTNYNPVEELYFSPGAYRGHVREYTLSETVYICEQTGFDVLHSNTLEHLAHSKLKFPLREIYLVLGNLIKSFRSGLLVIARKPADWVPAEIDEEKYRMAIMNAVPKGVRSL
jgi:SAM-dependent methyltransferase